MIKKVYCWIHPESESAGIVHSREEMDQILSSDPCAEEVDYETYLKWRKEWESTHQNK